LDFSLNKTLHRDSSCKEKEKFGDEFSPDFVSPDPPIIPDKSLEPDSTRVIDSDTSQSHDLDPGSVNPIESDLGKQPDTQSEDSPVPTVLESLAQAFPANFSMVNDNEPPDQKRRITHASHGIIKPNPKYALLAAASDIPVPRSSKTALAIPEWKLAMENEIKALHDNATWSLVPRQQDDNVIVTKWVFKVKAKDDGSVDRYKARLVANGMKQVHGVDYLGTFSPVVHPLSIRLVLALAVSNNWSIHQIDVSNAFLHGRLDERIIVAQPPGFCDKNSPDSVCLLHKSLYGLKQSPRLSLIHISEPTRPY